MITQRKHCKKIVHNSTSIFTYLPQNLPQHKMRRRHKLLALVWVILYKAHQLMEKHIPDTPWKQKSHSLGIMNCISKHWLLLWELTFLQINKWKLETHRNFVLYFLHKNIQNWKLKLVRWSMLKSQPTERYNQWLSTCFLLMESITWNLQRLNYIWNELISR